MASTTTRGKAAERLALAPETLEAIRQSQADNHWLEEHPEELMPFRGEWAVVSRQRVIAHARDGREVARVAPAHLYPGSTMFYVPAHEASEAVRIL